MKLRIGPGTKYDENGGLGAGAQVQVRCQKSWCQIPDGRWVSKSGLGFGGGSTVVATQPQMQIGAAPSQTQQASFATFAGMWRSNTNPPIDLAIVQDGQQLRGSSNSGAGRISLSGQADGAIAGFTGQQIFGTQTFDWAGQMQLTADGRMNMNVSASRPGDPPTAGTMIFSRLN
jgi:hypothetical protein